MTIDGLLRTLDLNPRMVVVEHNGEIVRRDRYEQVEVKGGDALELVHFVGGG
jgi:thiamine biosynthesis protein ThiS